MGREILSRPDLRVVVADDQWNETAHELDKRLAAIIRHGHLSPSQADDLMRAITELVETHVIEIIPRDFYAQVESVARRRIPRNPQDWQTVALAIVLGAPILTGDQVFLGCGCPTWTVETLLQELK